MRESDNDLKGELPSSHGYSSYHQIHISFTTFAVLNECLTSISHYEDNVPLQNTSADRCASADHIASLQHPQLLSPADKRERVQTCPVAMTLSCCLSRALCLKTRLKLLMLISCTLRYQK